MKKAAILLMVLSLLFALTLRALAQNSTIVPHEEQAAPTEPGAAVDPLPVDPHSSDNSVPVPEPSTLALLVAGMPCFFLAHFTSCDIAFVLLTNF